MTQLIQLKYVLENPVEGQETLALINNGDPISGYSKNLNDFGTLNKTTVQLQQNIEILQQNIEILLQNIEILQQNLKG